MDIDNLVRMANRIGDFFAAYPDTTEAQAAIAQHLQLFWTPPMRAALLAAVATEGGAPELHAPVRKAVLRHLATTPVAVS